MSRVETARNDLAIDCSAEVGHFLGAFVDQQDDELDVRGDSARWPD